MHALRKFLEDAMSARRWAPVDLARSSGLSKQLVSNLLQDDRDTLAAPLKRSTVAGLARAFGVTEDRIARLMFEAMGYRIPDGPITDLAAVPPEALLLELEQRLLGHARGQDTTDGPPITQADTTPPLRAVTSAHNPYQPHTDLPFTQAARPGRIDHGQAGDMSNVGEENQDPGDEA